METGKLTKEITANDFLIHLGFAKNILADEGYNFYSMDVDGIEVTCTVLSKENISTCMHYGGTNINLPHCSNIDKVTLLIKSITV